MKVSLGLTHNCNLSCKYCYAGRKSNSNMSIITARKIVDFTMENAPPERKIEFCFFGGEPLLCFDLMKEIISYIRKKEQESRKAICLSITTNGTLLTQTILDFFKDEKVNLCISIDGPAHVHNLNRCYRDGQGSFEDVMRKIGLAITRLGSLQVNAVYGPETIDFLSKTVSFFVQIGIPVIHLNPNINSFWEKTTYSKFQAMYMNIANQYIQNYQKGNELAINLIDSKIIIMLKDGYQVADKCSMGETEWGFAPSGNIYPCERFIGEDKDHSLCLGNIHTGLDLKKRCALLKRRGNHNEECKTCLWQKFCMNWCGCTNYYLTGHTDLAGPMMCESEKAAIQAAKHVLNSLKENELFLDHFMSYFHERRPFYP